SRANRARAGTGKGTRAASGTPRSVKRSSSSATSFAKTSRPCSSSSTRISPGASTVSYGRSSCRTRSSRPGAASSTFWICSSRRADVALYESTKKRLVAAGAEVIHLTTSFRSLPSIQEAVNAAFEPLMQGSEDGSQASYVPLKPFRDESAGRPTVVALPVPRPYSDWGKIVKFRIEESIPDAVGAFVDFLIRKSGFTITERE